MPQPVALRLSRNSQPPWLTHLGRPRVPPCDPFCFSLVVAVKVLRLKTLSSLLPPLFSSVPPPATAAVAALPLFYPLSLPPPFAILLLCSGREGSSLSRRR